jgi:hypothetical protein
MNDWDFETTRKDGYGILIVILLPIIPAALPHERMAHDF